MQIMSGRAEVLSQKKRREDLPDNHTKVIVTSQGEFGKIGRKDVTNCKGVICVGGLIGGDGLFVGDDSFAGA